MNYEEIKGKEVKEIQELLSNSYDEYAALVATKSVEETKEMEKELMKEFDEYDEHIQIVKYKLEDHCEFEGKKYNANEVCKKLVYFFNKLEVGFQETLGIHQAISFWKKGDITGIPYGTYDSTLRLLGTLKFKGDSEMQDILIVNNFLSSAHKEYATDTTFSMYLAQKHQCLMENMKESEPTE